MNLSQLGDYWRNPPILRSVIDPKLPLLHARFKLAYYKFLLERVQRKRDKWSRIVKALEKI